MSVEYRYDALKDRLMGLRPLSTEGDAARSSESSAKKRPVSTRIPLRVLACTAHRMLKNGPSILATERCRPPQVPSDHFTLQPGSVQDRCFRVPGSSSMWRCHLFRICEENPWSRFPLPVGEASIFRLMMKYRYTSLLQLLHTQGHTSIDDRSATSIFIPFP